MSSWKRGALILAGLGLLYVGCVSKDTPTNPDGIPGNGAGGNSASALHPTNTKPTLRLRTRPAYDTTTVPPSIFGEAPLTVNFNLCESTDPDTQTPDPRTGIPDSLNWEFHWGDDGTEPFNADGSFHANFSGFCRQDHEYGGGRFVATLSVTDKHLEDQSRDVSASARDTIQVAVNAVAIPAGNSSNSIETVRPPL